MLALLEQTGRIKKDLTAQVKEAKDAGINRLSPDVTVEDFSSWDSVD